MYIYIYLFSYIYIQVYTYSNDGNISTTQNGDAILDTITGYESIHCSNGDLNSGMGFYPFRVNQEQIDTYIIYNTIYIYIYLVVGHFSGLHPLYHFISRSTI